MTYVDWEERAQRDIDPVAIWNHAMRNNFKQHVFTEEEIKKQKRSEEARKKAQALLAKNPNYFKELAEKAKLKRLESKLAT